MKNLNTYINEAWTGVKKQTHNQDVIAWCEEMEIENYTINSNGEIDVDGDVWLKDMYIKELPYKFDTVNGSFTMDGNKKLTSLKNCPDKVTNYFSCSKCTSLKSLEGAPKEVGGSFYCGNCTSLTSLKGAPKEVSDGFWCERCTSLKTLEGAPKEVGEDFWCPGCTSLTSLNGAPEVVGGGFYCGGCKVKFTKEDVEKVSKVKGNIRV